MTVAHRHGPRVAAAAGVVVALLLAGVPATDASVAGRHRPTADPPRTGYPLPADGTAAGGWIGSRRVGHQVVYRIDPARKATASRLGPAHWLPRLRGSGPLRVTRLRVRRAAWVLAKYGTYRSDAQSAAVEVALDALLYGGRYGWRGAETRQRIRRTGAADSVLPLARYMLDHSVALAGPYRVRIRVQGAAVGDQMRVDVAVTSTEGGRPVPHLPVTVAFAGRALSRTTGAAGAATAQATAPLAGPQPVRVTVHRLPSDRLLVRRPVRGGGSRVVVAGRKVRAVRDLVVAIRARPVVHVSAPGTGPITEAVPGTVRVAAGYASPRSATATLHGPFGSRPAAACDAAPVASSTLPVSRDGSYDVPGLTAPAPGVYRWSVALSGDAYNLPAAACGEKVVVKAVPLLSVASSDGSVGRGTRVRARVRVTRLPDGYADEVAVRLYGPFPTRAAVDCSDRHVVRRRTVEVTGPATRGSTAPVSLRRTGVYAWQAVLPPALLSTREVTTCGGAGSTVRVG